MTTDFSDYFAYGALASPARTPEHTPPELTVLKPSSRGRTTRDFTSISAPLHPFESPESQNANVHDRFTPTLHASLVSEILSLRRELDSKHQFIDGLEDNFKSVQNENEALAEQLRESNKKSRQLEQKFKHLENGSFDAVEGLLGERDNVKNANQELRAKLEAASKRARLLEQENVRIRDSWDKERRQWESEKRQLEQRLHISDSRLRALAQDMNAQQEALEDQRRRDENSGDSDFASIRSSRYPKHTRNQSSMSNKSFAQSLSSVKHPGMTSLAQELNSDDDDDYDTEGLENEEDDLPLIVDKRWSGYSRASGTSDCKAKKILGLTINSKPDVSKDDGERTPSIDSTRTPSIAARLGLHMAKVGFRSSDTSRTSSRSTSPSRQNDEAITEHTRDAAPVKAANTGPIAQTHVPTQLKLSEQGTQPKLPNMLKSNNSVEAPISPPDTPQTALLTEDARPESQPKLVYQSASTQTDLGVAGDLASRRNAPIAPVEVLSIPAITIQPPMSPSFGETVLPPGMCSVSVQTDTAVTLPMHDVGVQTEEIRIDQRPIKLPPHLLPSALEQGTGKENLTMSVEHENQSVARHKPTMHRSTFSRDGNRLPLKALDLPPPKLRSLSRERHQPPEIKAEYDGRLPQWYADSDASDRQGESSDMDTRAMYGNIPGLVRPSVRTIFSGPPKTVPENRAISPANTVRPSDKDLAFTDSQRKGSDESSTQSRPSSSRGMGGSRRTGPFFSSHERNNSRPSSTGSYNAQSQPPPFPIPSRMSSRPPSREEPQSPTVPDAYSMRSRRSSKDSRIAPGGDLRKVRSSGTMRTNTHTSPRRRRRANLEPIHSVAFDGPPNNDRLSPSIVTPAREGFGSPNEALFDLDSPDFDQDSAVEEEEEPSQDNAIVDAIAATMVGEWMWKYVRRRRSFGLGESRADQMDDGAGSSGIRHKRWVWLSPYEHTVMWSAKQPNSGPALLGKNGRKLAIKSVLDVKDATPLHRSAAHEPIFDRSILILTPERALKFTASNRERHYLWLTALSFLAQSGRGPPQVPRVSPIPDAAPGPDQRRRSSLMPGMSQPARALVGPAPPIVRVEAPQRCGTADSTAPPNISRFPGARHQRKRSSTNPQFLASNDKSLPIDGAMTASSVFARRASNTAISRPPLNNSARSSLRADDRTSFFDAVGTVRMDAFIDKNRKDVSMHPEPRRNSRYRGDLSSNDLAAEKEYRFGEREVDPFAEF